MLTLYCDVCQVQCRRHGILPPPSTLPETLPRCLQEGEPGLYGGVLEAEVDVVQPVGAPQELHHRVSHDDDALRRLDRQQSRSWIESGREGRGRSVIGTVALQITRMEWMAALRQSKHGSASSGVTSEPPPEPSTVTHVVSARM